MLTTIGRNGSTTFRPKTDKPLRTTASVAFEESGQPVIVKRSLSRLAETARRAARI